ncbi:MAG: Branched-chain amino acid transport ATP-binding protein LivF [Anaerolineae bacterium]|jgi:branched-chain amino acid transport system ATP-binding protein|nr:MAG: Branched-chain amino acid transport ATP-binding protein LivF [Anaerolineae bacterium]
MLTVENLHVRYGQIEVLHGVSLQVGEREVVAVLGANGAGKSTLIKTIIGWLKPAQGGCKLNNETIDSLPTWERVKRGIAIVPESGRLFRELSVEDNLRLGAYLSQEQDTRKQIEVVFNLFPILAERRKQIAKTLSGGEQQMLAIGRAMMSNPRLLLIDEVSMGLMPILVKRVFQVIKELPQHNVSVLLVEQNAFEALKIVHRAYVLENGHLVLEGKAQELADNPLVKAAYLGG